MKKTYLSIILIAIVLSACSGNIAKPPIKAPDNAGGGYYRDDGPKNNPPKNLDSIPNAVPKYEPLKKSSTRPYKALGKTYYPLNTAKNYKARGIATWYGRRYHGKKTASGEVYDMYAMTAAHKILPLPSYAKVTNIKNGRSIIVRINDRGPFVNGREIDLSYVAAHQLRLIKQGSGLVEVESITLAKRAPNNQAKAASTPITEKNSAPPITKGQYYIQAGVFKNKSNAIGLVKRLESLNHGQNTKVLSVYNGRFHKVTLGPYNSHQDAEQFAQTIEQKLNTSTIINQR